MSDKIRQIHFITCMMMGGNVVISILLTITTIRYYQLHPNGVDSDMIYTLANSVALVLAVFFQSLMISIYFKVWCNCTNCTIE